MNEWTPKGYRRKIGIWVEFELECQSNRIGEITVNFHLRSIYETISSQNIIGHTRRQHICALYNRRFHFQVNLILNFSGKSLNLIRRFKRKFLFFYQLEIDIFLSVTERAKWNSVCQIEFNRLRNIYKILNFSQTQNNSLSSSLLRLIVHSVVILYRRQCLFDSNEYSYLLATKIFHLTPLLIPDGTRLMIRIAHSGSVTICFRANCGFFYARYQTIFDRGIL